MAHKDIDVLMTGPMMPMIIEQLGAAFTLHRLWEAPDADKAIADLAPRIRGVAAAPGRPCGPALLSRLPKAEIVASFGVGYDHIDAAFAGANGMVVTNTPDVLNEEVADTALGLLLMTVRQLPQSERYLRAGQWLKAPFPLSQSLRDRQVGIVGMGRIGKAIGKRLEAFGVPVSYHARNRQNVSSNWVYYDNLVAMARDVDVLLLILPGGAATRHMVNREVLTALGPNGILINVARGSVVDEQALIAALKDGTILSAGLDVFEDEPRVPQALIDMEHIVLLPHVGSASVHTRRAMGQLTVDNLLSWAAGKGPLTPVVETPWPPRSSG
jgi:lactate dehydrogenase-like 2-hydroxyacid dehydrogenase